MLDFVERAQAMLTIDLGSIAANWQRLAARMPPGGRCAAVVKADAYGLGVSHVVPALRAAGCTRFVVGNLDEALAVRPLLDESDDLLALHGPHPGTEAEFLANGLLPVLNTPGQVAGWAALAGSRGRRLPAALHVDTGMSRLGLSHAEAVAVAEDRATLAAIEPVLVMSHLACADEPAHPLNRRQLQAFLAARALFPGVEGSLAASSGMFLGPDWLADWGRPGAALYGIQPTADGPKPMSQVVRLQGKILQVRDIDEGETVGYGATHRVARPSRLATVGVGYADGFLRSLSNRGCGHLGGVRVPLVGRVSMDLIVFDVSGVPADMARPGALIDLIGPANTVDDVASAAGTNGYEVLTSLGRRYGRRYVGGGAR